MAQIVLSSAFRQALDSEDWNTIEELWLESLDQQPIPIAELLEVRRLLWKGGKKHLARTLLELLVETLESGENPKATLAALRELLRLTEKPGADLIERIVKAIRQTYQKTPSLEAVLKQHPIIGSRRPLDEVEKALTWLGFDIGSAVEIKDQGVGKVVELNLQLGNLRVDLGGSRPVSIPSGAIQRFVRSLPEGSFLWKKVMDSEALKSEVLKDPAGSLGHLLEGYNEAVSVSTIKAALEGLVTKQSWSSWWTKARKNARILASGGGSRLQYSISDSAEDAEDLLVRDLENSQAREALKIAKALIARGKDAAQRAEGYLNVLLEQAVTKESGLAWEIAETIRLIPGQEEKAQDALEELAAQANAMALLAGIQDRGIRGNCLEAIRRSREDSWAPIWAEWLLHEKTGSLLGTISQALLKDSYEDFMDAGLETIFRNHMQHPHQFLWACESMVKEDCPALLRSRMRPSLLEKIPDALSRKEFAELRSRAKGLLDAGEVALRIILEQATPQQAQRFAQRIARINAVEPGQVRLVEQALRQCRGPETAEEIDPSALFVASEEAIETKRVELRQLLDEEIPKTLKGIQAAAAEGDLRENFEYHMLRDRQELLSAKAAKLQEELTSVLVLEHDATDTSRVNIGSIVEFESEDGKCVAPLTILGAWDGDLDNRIYANGTELARKLFGAQEGDTVEVEGQKVRIAKITAW